MNDLEKQLNKLPKYNLSRKTDMKIRLRMFLVSIKGAPNSWPESLVWPQYRFALVTLVLLSLVISIPGYAYASSAVTEGHWLYGVKRGIEEVELVTKISPEAQALALAKLTERRFEEAAHLAEKKAEEDNKNNEEAKITKIIKKALEYNKASQVIYEAIPEEEVKKETAEKIEEKKVSQLEAISMVAQDIGLGSTDTTLDTITEALAVVKTKPGEMPKRFFKPFPQSEEMESEPSSEALEDEEGKIKEAEEHEDEKPSTRTWGRFVPPGQAKKFERNYEAVIEDIDKMEEDLNKKEYNKDDVETLYERIGKKLDQAEASIGEGNLRYANEVLEATKALSENAEHFVKPKKEEKNQSKNKGRSKKWENRDENNDSSIDSTDSFEASTREEESSYVETSEDRDESDEDKPSFWEYYRMMKDYENTESSSAEAPEDKEEEDDDDEDKDEEDED